MTRVEAIRLLKTYRNCLFGILTEPIDMAIKALERQDELQHALDMEKGAYNALVKNIQCEDAISRQAVLDLINDQKDVFYSEGDRSLFESYVSELPPVMPYQNTGYWVYEPQKRMVDETDEGVVYRTEDRCKCSNCDADYGFTKMKDAYCRYCGAKMKTR